MNISYNIKGLGRPLGLQEVEALRISRQLTHEGGKVVSPRNQPPLLQEISLVLISITAESTPWL